jgi:hypothetical protein
MTLCNIGGAGPSPNVATPSTGLTMYRSSATWVVVCQLIKLLTVLSRISQPQLQPDEEYCQNPW